MPVTVNIVNHPAVGWESPKVTTSEKLLEAACPRQYEKCQRIVQSSFSHSRLSTAHISKSQNGFVWAAYHAYSQHHHLVIRPEDVWFAILIQLSFFINANAEDVRSFFVEHQGQEELEAISFVADFGALALQMTQIIAKNVIDPELREWVMPSFTTTQVDDKVVGAVLFMGAMQAYFTFRLTIMCGLPSVTLQGELGDWQEILKRIDKIDLLGEEPRQFASMLRPVLQHVILSFEDPTNSQVTNFWNTIVSWHHVGSGTDYLSGWLTAFCFWSEEGKAKGVSRHGENNLLFGDVAFPWVSVDMVPAGFASVPVTVDENGHVYPATMIAGSVGIAASSQQTSTNTPRALSELHEQTSINETSIEDRFGETVCNTVQPVSGWWICEDKAQVEGETGRVKRRLSARSVEGETGQDKRRLFRRSTQMTPQAVGGGAS